MAPDFEVLRRLDDSATGAVYLARETALRRLVAVKVLAPELAESETARQRFEREARAVASVTHPNVVSIHRVGTMSDGLPYLVMEHVEGRTLAERLRALGPVPIEDGRATLCALAGALEATHRANIVHRDVRPENVVRDDRTDRVFLENFGIAALLATGTEAVDRLTRTGEILGDVTYTSPELLEGREPSKESDIYSLGVLGYRLFTGRGPFAAESSAELTTAHLRQTPRRLSALRSDVPPDVDELLYRCLAKEPRHRPTATEVRRVLEGQASPGVVGAAGAEDPDPPRAKVASAPRMRERDRPPGGRPGKRPAAGGRFAYLGRVYRELRRRHVVRVGLVYAAVAWLLVQVAAATFPHLNLPSWSVTLVIVMTILGCPIVLVVAWAFEVTPDGIRRTGPETDDEGS